MVSKEAGEELQALHCLVWLEELEGEVAVSWRLEEQELEEEPSWPWEPLALTKQPQVHPFERQSP